MKHFLFFLVALPLLAFSAIDGSRTTINLNGIWQFDQTVNAFPPAKFTRTIPVPGLVHLATPKIDDYDKFFKRADKVEAKEQHNLYNIDYTPRYSWYRKLVFIPKELEVKEGMVTIKKSQYVTQIFVNGIDMGTSMACYTPVEFPITKALKYGAENEILIKVGDRVWLPSEAAGGTDKEKEHYLQGIWDDVLLSFTGAVRVNRLFVLPSVANKKKSNREMIYLGGGAGMAPLRSHLSYLFETEKTNRKVSFWYGARSVNDIFYYDYFRKLENENANFAFHLALSETDTQNDWNGSIGFIHEVLLKEYLSEHEKPNKIEY